MVAPVRNDFEQVPLVRARLVCRVFALHVLTHRRLAVVDLGSRCVVWWVERVSVLCTGTRATASSFSSLASPPPAPLHLPYLTLQSRPLTVNPALAKHVAGREVWDCVPYVDDSVACNVVRLEGRLCRSDKDGVARPRLPVRVQPIDLERRVRQKLVCGNEGCREKVGWGEGERVGAEDQSSDQTCNLSPLLRQARACSLQHLPTYPSLHPSCAQSK